MDDQKGNPGIEN